MSRTRWFLWFLSTGLVVSFAGGSLTAQGVAYRLKRSGQCGQTNPQAPSIQDYCAIDDISSCAWSTSGNVDIEGFTVAVEVIHPWIKVLEVNLGSDVSAADVNLFDHRILNLPDGRQQAVANVIFHPGTTLRLEEGEARAKSLIELRLQLDPNTALGEVFPGGFCIEYTEEVVINGFPQRNLVVVGGLSRTASSTTGVCIEDRTARLELLSCEVLPKCDSSTGQDAYQVRLRWLVFNEPEAQYVYTPRNQCSRAPHELPDDAAFIIKVDGVVRMDAQNRERDRRCFPAPQDPLPANLRRCEVPAGVEGATSCYETEVSFTAAEAAQQGGHHKFQVCAFALPICDVRGPPIEQCHDGRDNDGDQRIDCGDTTGQENCSRDPVCQGPLEPTEVCSNDCVSFIRVLSIDRITCREGDPAPDNCNAGPYWCALNPRFELRGVNFFGNASVRTCLDLWHRDPEFRQQFRQNGCKIVLNFGGTRECVLWETLFRVDATGEGVLYVDEPCLADNAWTYCGPQVAGVARNVPRAVEIQVQCYRDGVCVNHSVAQEVLGRGGEASVTYTFGWKRGDANLDTVVDVVDVVDKLNGMFLPRADQPASPHYLACHRSANANGGQGRGFDNDTLNIADCIYLLNYLVRGGGPPPLAPFDTDPLLGYGIPGQPGIPATPLRECEDPWAVESSPRVICPWGVLEPEQP